MGLDHVVEGGEARFSMTCLCFKLSATLMMFISTMRQISCGMV